MITLLKQPQTYTPVNNPVLFQFSSDTPSLLYYKIEVRNQANAVVSVLKYDAFPSIESYVSFDLAETLKPFINNQIINNNNIIVPLADAAFKFRLNITGFYRFDGEDAEGASLLTDWYTVWDAAFNRVEYHSYQFKDYVLTTSGSTAKFLSGKPAVSNIYSTDTEHLYLLNNGLTANVKVEFYTKGHTLVGSHIISGITSGSTGYRINVSPATLSTFLGDNFSNMYGNEFDDVFDVPFGSAFNIEYANYYTVQVVGSGNTVFSETRTYVMKNHNCKLKNFQLIYSNQIGGIDSITLFNPKEEINVTRTTIKNSSIDDEIVNGVYTPATGIINSNSTSTYKAITGVLSDAEALAIKDIIKSKDVLIKLENGLLMPVQLSNTSYAVQQKRYSTNNNRVQIEFSLPDSGLFD